MSRTTSPYRLVRTPTTPAVAPVLDPAQAEVVAHDGGPLLVLAGPGTGKTTTLVEAVVRRIEAGADPEQVLVLTFGRLAAAELRTRIAARLGRATKEPLARTFHSYAFGVLHREAAARGERPPRLLAGPEQDVVVRDLLAGDLADGASTWPSRLHPALPTQGFAQELRDLVMRAFERGVTDDRLRRLGAEQGRDDWVAAAQFMQQYSEVSSLREAASYDPAELIRAVVDLWADEPGQLAAERAARPHVFVDELQDTDPAQIELLTLLAGEGRDLVAVGDPDQAIYGFRGADVAGIRGFREHFRTLAGDPAPVIDLATSRRAGSVLLAASRRVARGLGGRRRHRDLLPAVGVPDGELSVAVLRSESQEAAHVAARLREAHLVDGVPWSQMAVVVRSTVHSMPVLRRAMVGAGIPVAVSGDEVPLVREPAVGPLLMLLKASTRDLADPLGPDGQPGFRPIPEDDVSALLTSSLGGADVMGLRRLRQALRRAELLAGGGRSSGALLVAALHDPGLLSGLPRAVARPASTIAELVAAGRAAAGASASAEDVLWELWSRSGLADRWERASREGGPAGEAADRDLDAVVALFEAAARFCDRLPGAGPQVFYDHLTGQQIPGDSPAVRAVATEAVQLLTAHASKGLEWDVVCVAGVQEGSWPDLRMRGSFLGSERLVELIRPGAEATAPAVATVTTLGRLLDEERRLFYVAVTRARRSLLVTAVTSEREALLPSRFLDEIDPPAGAEPRPLTVVRRPLSLVGLVADLRRTLLDPEADEPRREAAAQRLAVLAAAGARGADPQSWWGLAPMTGDGPLRAPDDLVVVSPSRVESFRRCELRWFLEQAGGGTSPGPAQAVGTLVHAVAETAVDPSSSTEAALLARLEELLPHTDLGSGWVARKERERAEAMVRRLAGWLASNARDVVATEQDIDITIDRARLVGRVDRVERDEAGRAVVVDLKTGSSKTKEAELMTHGQLAAYQLAAEHGAFAGTRGSGGAELLQVGGGAATKGAVAQQQVPLAESSDPDWARSLVLDVAEGMAGSAFRAVANDYCQMCPVRTSCPVQDDGRAVTS